jgi:hypothetical protein
MKKKSLSNQQRIHRIRVILGIIIAATIPFYCSGLILLNYYPQNNTETPTATGMSSTPSPTLDTPTQESSQTPTIVFSATASETPKRTATVTYTPFLSPTTTNSPTAINTSTMTVTPVPTQTEIVADTATVEIINTLIPTEKSTLTPIVKPTDEVSP